MHKPDNPHFPEKRDKFIPNINLYFQKLNWSNSMSFNGQTVIFYFRQ